MHGNFVARRPRGSGPEGPGRLKSHPLARQRTKWLWLAQWGELDSGSIFSPPGTPSQGGKAPTPSPSTVTDAGVMIMQPVIDSDNDHDDRDRDSSVPARLRLSLSLGASVRLSHVGRVTECVPLRMQLLSTADREAAAARAQRLAGRAAQTLSLIHISEPTRPRLI
eukprot:2528152-Rhodomonas_salina.1